MRSVQHPTVVFGHNLHDNIQATGVESFRHRIDSYLESDDWTGSRFHECPYDNIQDMFNKEQFVESILGTKGGDNLFEIAQQPIITF